MEQTVAYQYDGSGNLVSIGYAGGKIAIAYSSDPPYTSVATVTTPDGAVRQYSVPNDPTQIQVTDGNGDATLYVSNPAGLLLSATDPAGNTVSYTYDTSGRRIRTVDGNGATASFTYDANGNLAGITDGAGNRWSADYTAAVPAHITDPNGNIWAFKYDSSGNLVGVTNPAGGVVSAVRSASGQITGITDARGNKTSYQYDANGLIADVHRRPQRHVELSVRRRRARCRRAPIPAAACSRPATTPATASPGLRRATCKWRSISRVFSATASTAW